MPADCALVPPAPRLNSHACDGMAHLQMAGKHVQVGHCLRGPQPHNEARQRLQEEVEEVDVVAAAPVEHGR